MKNTTVKIGKEGEERALDYLLDKGYKFISKNFYTNDGEIDLICMQRDILVFVEVKTRKNSLYLEARESVSKIKQKKIRLVANSFINTRSISFKEIRFDVIEYYTEDNRLEHFVDAF